MLTTLGDGFNSLNIFPKTGYLPQIYCQGRNLIEQGKGILNSVVVKITDRLEGGNPGIIGQIDSFIHDVDLPQPLLHGLIIRIVGQVLLIGALLVFQEGVSLGEVLGSHPVQGYPLFCYIIHNLHRLFGKSGVFIHVLLGNHHILCKLH